MSKRRTPKPATGFSADSSPGTAPDGDTGDTGGDIGGFDIDPAALIPKATGKRPEMTEEVRALWQRHFAGDKAARNELVELYFPLAEINAEHMVAVILKAVEDSDFAQTAVVGFLESIDDYKNDDSGLPFEEYSSLKIRKAILDELTGYFEQG